MIFTAVDLIQTSPRRNLVDTQRYNRSSWVDRAGTFGRGLEVETPGQIPSLDLLPQAIVGPVDNKLVRCWRCILLGDLDELEDGKNHIWH